MLAPATAIQILWQLHNMQQRMLLQQAPGCGSDVVTRNALVQLRFITLH